MERKASSTASCYIFCTTKIHVGASNRIKIYAFKEQPIKKKLDPFNEFCLGNYAMVTDGYLNKIPLALKALT